MENLLFQIFSDDRFMDLTLYQYGYERCLPLHSYGPAVRNHYLFHYIISGKGTLSVDKVTYSKDTKFTEEWGFSLSPDRSIPITQTGRIPGNTPGSSLTE